MGDELLLQDLVGETGAHRLEPHQPQVPIQPLIRVQPDRRRPGRGSSFSDAFSLLQNTGDVDIAEMPYNQR